MQSKKLLLIVMFVLANVLGFTALANAGTVVMEFDNEIDVDNDPPGGNPPWLTATFQDNGTDAVLLTIQGSLHDANESIKRIWFNTVSGFDANSLTITQREGGPASTFAGAQQDGFGGTGIQHFDVQFKWTEHAFINSDTVQFDISGLGLTANTFASKNNNSTFQFFSIAQVGGVADANNKHGGVPHDELIAPTAIPLPASLLLGVMGLMALPLLVTRWGRTTA